MKTLQLRYAGTVMALVMAASTLLWSRNTPVNATWAANYSGSGVFGLTAGGAVQNTAYNDGEGSVRCYFGVKDKNVVLLTYSNRANPDPRMLHFVAGDYASAFAALGLPDEFSAEVDFFGISHGGPYTDMQIGDVVRLHADLEFHYSDTNTVATYEFAYGTLAAIRQADDNGHRVWLITSDEADVPAGSGVFPSATADLKQVRRKGGGISRTVEMPIRFLVTQ